MEMRKEEVMVDQYPRSVEGGRGADCTEETRETVKEGDRLPDQPTRVFLAPRSLIRLTLPCGGDVSQRVLICSKNSALT